MTGVPHRPPRGRHSSAAPWLPGWCCRRRSWLSSGRVLGWLLFLERWSRGVGGRLRLPAPAPVAGPRVSVSPDGALPSGRGALRTPASAVGPCPLAEERPPPPCTVLTPTSSLPRVIWGPSHPRPLSYTSAPGRLSPQGALQGSRVLSAWQVGPLAARRGTEAWHVCPPTPRWKPSAQGPASSLRVRTAPLPTSSWVLLAEQAAAGAPSQPPRPPQPGLVVPGVGGLLPAQALSLETGAFTWVCFLSRPFYWSVFCRLHSLPTSRGGGGGGVGWSRRRGVCLGCLARLHT